MGWLWLLPTTFLPLIAVGLGIAVMFGVLSFGRAVGILLVLLLAPVLIDAVVGLAFDVLPLWLLLLSLALIGIHALRFGMSMLLGEHAAGHVIGHFATQAVTGAFRLLLLPFRALGWLLTRAIG